MNNREQRVEEFMEMIADIAYDIHETEGISEELREKLLNLWRLYS